MSIEVAAALVLGIVLGIVLVLVVIALAQHAERVGENDTDWITVDLEQNGGTGSNTVPTGPMPLGKP